jgi:hypothetical protein
MAFYSLFTPWLGPYFVIHPQLTTIFWWLVYDVNQPGYLPPNTLPCVIVSPMIFLVLAIFFSGCFCCGILARVSQRIQEALNPNQKETFGYRDISKMIPPSDVTISNVTRPLDNLQSGNFTNLDLPNLTPNTTQKRPPKLPKVKLKLK